MNAPRALCVATAAFCLAAGGSSLALAAPASAWTVAPVPESPGSCRARLEGAEVNLTLLINRDDKLILIAGRGDWSQVGDPVDTALAIDGAPSAHLSATPLGPLVLALVDDAILERLRAAKAIDWTLPKGRFHIEVEGLGAAMDGVRACQKSAARRP